MKRKPIFKLTTPEQLRVLGAPATLEVFESLQTGGPATTAEVAARVGRKANTLHYHVRKLVKLGLVRKVGSRRSGARTEIVYDVVAERFDGSPAPSDPELRQATADIVASLLRVTNRDYARALERPEAMVPDGDHRTIAAQRLKAWLDRDTLADLNAHARAIEEILRRNSEPGSGELFAVTLVLTPLPPMPLPDDKDG